MKRPEDEVSTQDSLRVMGKKPLPHMLATTNMLLHGIEDLFFRRHDNTLARSYNSWKKNGRMDIIPTNPSFGGREGTALSPTSRSNSGSVRQRT